MTIAGAEDVGVVLGVADHVGESVIVFQSDDSNVVRHAIIYILDFFDNAADTTIRRIEVLYDGVQTLFVSGYQAVYVLCDRHENSVSSIRAGTSSRRNGHENIIWVANDAHGLPNNSAMNNYLRHTENCGFNKIASLGLHSFFLAAIMVGLCFAPSTIIIISFRRVL